MTASGWSQTPSNKKVTVTDDHVTFDPAWTVTAGDGEQRRTYEVTWTVDEAGTCQTFTNVATITGDSGLTDTDDAEVQVCRAADLTVEKTITAQLDRTWVWDVDKTARGTQPYEADKQTGDITVGYDVTVTPAPPATPGGWSAAPSR
ncbi:hypothetical protein G7085_08590 [Tessaracoccus sp. HDW20]|uniref:hypothetical protein n=1 Tax=Tessaracoccus coleopterorum TaxID=2714950 RepID=UPI0018D44720|nr:hypothetical protein [Tessaracoccus coleopterorum]NHB84648.1 hypothetical protein [Tessaracoccus coleopterorum]